MTQNGKTSNKNKRGQQNFQQFQKTFQQQKNPTGKRFNSQSAGGRPTTIKTRYGRLKETTPEIELAKIGAKENVSKSRARAAGFVGAAGAVGADSSVNNYYTLADGGIGDSNNGTSDESSSEGSGKSSKKKKSSIVING